MLLLNLYDLLLIEQKILFSQKKIQKTNSACVFFLLFFSFSFERLLEDAMLLTIFFLFSSCSACLCSHIGTPTHHFSLSPCFYSITVSFILRSDNEEYRNLCICLCICLCVREKKNLISFSHICSFVRLFRIIGADFSFLSHFSLSLSFFLSL